MKIIVAILLVAAWALASDPQQGKDTDQKTDKPPGVSAQVDFGATSAAIKCSDPRVKGAKPGQYRHVYCVSDAGVLTVDGSPVNDRIAEIEAQSLMVKFKSNLQEEYIEKQALTRLFSEREAMYAKLCKLQGIEDPSDCIVDVSRVQQDGTYDLKQAITRKSPPPPPPPPAPAKK